MKGIFTYAGFDSKIRKKNNFLINIPIGPPTQKNGLRKKCFLLSPVKDKINPNFFLFSVSKIYKKMLFPSIIFGGKLFIWFFLVLLVLLGLGSLVSFIFFKRPFIFGRNIFLKVFFNILISFLLLSSLTAITYSGGKTFQWIVLLSLIGILISFRKNNDTLDGLLFIGFKRIKPKDIVILFITGLFSFVLLFALLGFPENHLNIGVYYDFFFYSELSSSLLRTGLENTASMLTSYVEPSSLALYHYSDLWFNGLLTKIIPLSETETLLFITYPVLLFLTIIGSAGVLAESFLKSRWGLLLISVFLLMGISIVLPFEINPLYQQGVPRYGGGPALSPVGLKTLILFPIVLLSFSFLEKGRLDLTVLGFLIAMAAYNTTIPAYVGGLSMLLGFYFLFGNKLRLNPIMKYAKKGLIFIAAFLLLLLFFILLFIQTENLPVEQGALPVRSIIIIFIESLLAPWLFFWLMGVMILFLLFKKRQNGLVIPFIVLITGAQLAGALFVVLSHGTRDAGQALSNALPVLFTVGSVFLFRDLPMKKWSLIFLLVLFSLSSTLNFSNAIKKLRDPGTQTEEFRVQVEAGFKSSKDFKNWLSITSSPSDRWHYNWFTPGKFVFNIKNANYPLDVSGFLFLDQDTWCGINDNSQSPLCYLLNKNPHLNREEVFAIFLMEGPATFLYAESPELIPIEALSHLELIAKDSKTGEAFYSIHKEKK